MLEKGLSLTEVCRQLDGDFAIVVVDLADATVTVARDPYGVRPLFFGRGDSWSAFASEIKAFPAGLQEVKAIEPGTVASIQLNDRLNGRRLTEERWHEVPWLKVPHFRYAEVAESALFTSLVDAVGKRLATVRDIGACLSGGLDSSLVAAIAAEILSTEGKKLHTYSIGMEGSSDLKHARQVAEHIGSIHHECLLSHDECLAAIPDVIKAIESYDITTVRASVGNYLLGAFIARETPTVKVVLNGDGADELLGGYLYMRAAPTDAAFETELDRLLREIHRYDVLRSERSMAAHGLESRSPFLDRHLIATARGIPTMLLRPNEAIMEKNILRSACAASRLLPESVLWRRKEAFSDGISPTGRSWFEIVQEQAEQLLSESSGSISTDVRYSVNQPKTAEAFWYRFVFHLHYPSCAAALIPAMWMPRFIAGATDPSARTLTLY